MVEDKNISKTYNNLVDEILKKKNPGEILEELSRPHQPTGSLQGKPGKSTPGAPVPRKTFKESFPWSYVKDSYLFSGKALVALVYFIIAMVLVNNETIKGFIFYDLGIRLYLSSVFFHWITDFFGFLATEAAIFTIWPLLLSFLSALMKDKENAKLKYRIYDILYMVVVISILSLAVLFVNVDRNKKACYLETYNYYCAKHQVANLEIPGIKIDVTKVCKAGNDACDFTGVYENNEYRLKLKMCRETINAGLLSADFVSVNTGLFESLLEAKWAKMTESNVNERLRKFKDQVNRYQSFILGISGDREFKEFLKQLAPDPAVLDILVLFYYLDNKWSQPGLVLKARMLQIVKNKFLIENNVGPTGKPTMPSTERPTVSDGNTAKDNPAMNKSHETTLPTTESNNKPPQKEVAQVHKPPVPEAKTEKANPVTNNNPYEIGLYYPLAGTFEVSGEIRGQEWNWDNDENCWTSTIRDFSVNAELPKRKGTFNFNISDFEKNPIEHRYHIIVDNNNRKRFLYALTVHLYGFSENNRPDDLHFYQEQTIKKGKSKFVPFTINDISIRNAKAEKIEFEKPFTGGINPVINIYFVTSSPTQEKTGAVKSQSTETLALPSSQASNAPIHPTSTLGWGRTLGIELKNYEEIIIKNFIWEAPFSPMSLPIGINYATIEIITPFGRGQCDKPGNNQLILSDFVKPVKVNVNEGDAEIYLMYSKDSGESWNTFQIAKSDQTLKSATIYLPRLVPNNSTTWRLAARKGGFKNWELSLGYLSKDEDEIRNTIELRKEVKTEKDNPVMNSTPDKIGIYYPMVGTFEVSGKISDGEWKRNNAENCWASTIRDFSVTANWQGHSKSHAFIKSGIVKNKVNQRYEVVIDDNIGKVSTCALDIHLYGFSEKTRPYDFQFHQKQTINRGLPLFVPFKINDISIKNAKPKEIQFDKPPKGAINPVINVYFDTPSPSASSHPASILGLGSTLGIELKNDKGILIKYLKWESPFNVIDLSADKYSTIELITPFGRCRCKKPANNKLTLSEFIKPVKVNINEGDAEICLMYSKDSGESWNTFQIAKSDQTSKTVAIFLPEMVPTNTSITWRLTARKEGFKNWELPLGFLTADESEIKELINEINFEKVDKHMPTVINIYCKEKYERIGGKFDKLELLFFDKNDNLLFRDSLQAVEFVPEDAHRFRLNDPENKFAFVTAPINSLKEKLKIDFNTFGKSSDVFFRLIPKKTEIPIPEHAYRNVRFLDSKSNPINFQPDPDKTFKGNVLFSYSIDEDNEISSYSKTIKICCPGYRERTIEFKPEEFSSLSPLVIVIQMQLLLPEVVVIISGNRSSNRGEYYVWSRDAVIEIWDAYSHQMQVGVSDEGKVYMMKDWRALKNYGPSWEATNFYVNDEIKKAKEYFKVTIDGCGNPPPQRLVYIGREPGNINQNITGTVSIYIISSERKPTGWQGEWFMAFSKDSIKDALKKILEGN